MMFVHPVRTGRLAIPAVTHVDGTARVQTVDSRDHPDFERWIRAFFELTGCPMLVNTSFNVRGEPMVATPDDAIHCFLNTDIDILVMENRIVRSKHRPSTRSHDGDAMNPRDPKLIHSPSIRFKLVRRAFQKWNRTLGAIGLGIVYYGVVTPIGICWRMRKKPVPSVTFWRPLSNNHDLQRFYRTY